MHISELSRRTGVSLRSLRYYLRCILDWMRRPGFGHIGGM
ncbi:MerR family transcriptional regulator [Paenibacillus sp. 1P07SE]